MKLSCLLQALGSLFLAPETSVSKCEKLHSKTVEAGDKPWPCLWAVKPSEVQWYLSLQIYLVYNLGEDGCVCVYVGKRTSAASVIQRGVCEQKRNIAER